MLVGEARYLDDLELAGQVHIAFVRSLVAHANFTVDATPAYEIPNVVAVITAADLGKVPTIPRVASHPDQRDCMQPVLAVDRVRFVGEPIAVVVATHLYSAVDGARAVSVAYDDLPPVLTTEDATADNSPLLHSDIARNTVAEFMRSVGDADAAFAEADVVVRGRFGSHRYTGHPLETRGVLADYDPGSEFLTVRTSTQWPHTVRTALANVLEIPLHRIRVLAPDVGGGFGVKQEVYPEEILLALLSIRLGRPVKWSETRSEHFLAANHAREQIHDIEIAATRDGIVLGMRAWIVADMGAYLRSLGVMCPDLTAAQLPGPYRIQNYQVFVKCVLTNKTPVGAYRGAGVPEAIFATERAMDRVAQRLEVDPAEIRRRNFIPPAEFPWNTGLTASGVRFNYDSGEYEKGLDLALNLSGYEEWRKRQAIARSEGRLLGIGIATFVMLSGLGPFESASIRIEADGAISVVSGASPHGQGTATTLAQIAADELGVRPQDVRITFGDTALIPHGMGTYASRNGVVAGNAVYEAARKVRAKALQLASHLLEVSSDDLELQGGRCVVRGAPNRSISLSELGAASDPMNPQFPNIEPVLDATHYYSAPECTFSSGAHVAVVEIDRTIGSLEVLDYVIVTDAGRIINPMIATGQIVGGFAQGYGGSTGEQLVYDRDTGQPLTASFTSYLLPSSIDTPSVRTAFVETLSPRNPLGVKGLGESGTVGVPAALSNAVEDALLPLGISIDATPIMRQDLWAALKRAQTSERG